MKISFNSFILVILTCGHLIVKCFDDTCVYTNDQYLCGDVCLNKTQPCYCDGQKITGARASFYARDSYYCCAPASDCTRTKTGAKCSTGEVLNQKSPTPCNYTGRCFNDALTSQHLTTSRSHYTCQNGCINLQDWETGMCQGISFCAGDEEFCGPKLRCVTGQGVFR